MLIHLLLPPRMHWTDKNGSHTMFLPPENLSPCEKSDWIKREFEAAQRDSEGIDYSLIDLFNEK